MTDARTQPVHVADAAPARVPRHRRFALSRTAQGYAFIAPAIVYLAVTAVYPITSVVAMSVRDVNNGVWSFVGLAHYARAAGDAVLWISVRNTATFSVASTILHLVIGMTFALALHATWSWRGLRDVMRGALILPWIFSTAAAGLMWALFYHPFGLLNFAWFRFFGQTKPIEFLGDPNTALWAVIAVNAWKSYPFYMIAILGGLQGIATELYDAAKVDGAGAWQRFRYVTLPQLRPILVAISTLDLITSFGHVDLINMLTRGGPGYSTETVAHLVYKTALLDGNLPYGAAVSTLMLIVLAAFTAFYLRLISEREVAA